MRFVYKALPLNPPHPATGDASVLRPLLAVKLSHKHSPQTPRIEAMVDSGADECLFHADIGRGIGIDIEKGPKGSIGGIVPGYRLDVYYHDVFLWVVTDRIKIAVGFCSQLSVAGILGRRGFFDNFIVAFDPANNPPGFEVTRLPRA